MKDSLEYKILKYLSENDNGEFIDVSFLNENPKTVQSKIKDLKNNELIEFRKYILEDGYSRRFDCKIVLKGKEYIDKIDNAKINDSKNYFRGANIVQLNQADDLSVLKTKIKQTIYPTPKEIKQNPIILFIVKCWWQILIPLAIVIIGILIERDVINIRF